MFALHNNCFHLIASVSSCQGLSTSSPLFGVGWSVGSPKMVQGLNRGTSFWPIIGSPSNWDLESFWDTLEARAGRPGWGQEEQETSSHGSGIVENVFIFKTVWAAVVRERQSHKSLNPVSRKWVRQMYKWTYSMLLYSSDSNDSWWRKKAFFESGHGGSSCS